MRFFGDVIAVAAAGLAMWIAFHMVRAVFL